MLADVSNALTSSSDYHHWCRNCLYSFFLHCVPISLYAVNNIVLLYCSHISSRTLNNSRKKTSCNNKPFSAWKIDYIKSGWFTSAQIIRYIVPCCCSMRFPPIKIMTLNDSRVICDIKVVSVGVTYIEIYSPRVAKTTIINETLEMVFHREFICLNI